MIRTAHLLEKPWPPRGGMRLIPPGTLCQAPSSGHLPSHALRSVRGESPSPLFLLPSMLSFTASQKRERRGPRTTMPPNTTTKTCLPPSTRAEKGMSPQQLRLATRSRSAGQPSMRSKAPRSVAANPNFLKMQVAELLWGSRCPFCTLSLGPVRLYPKSPTP